MTKFKLYMYPYNFSCRKRLLFLKKFINVYLRFQLTTMKTDDATLEETNIAISTILIFQ